MSLLPMLQGLLSSRVPDTGNLTNAKETRLLSSILDTMIHIFSGWCISCQVVQSVITIWCFSMLLMS